MAARVAQEFREGWLVNLGIGIPTLCSNFAKEVIFHSENGVIGYGPQVAEGEENINMVNAGGQHVSLLPGGSIVHHADISRTGRPQAARVAVSAARWIWR